MAYGLPKTVYLFPSVTTQRLDRLPILGKIPAKTMTNQEARALYRQGEVVAV